MGGFTAVVIGCSLLLEYAVSGTAIAVGWSSMPLRPDGRGGYPPQRRTAFYANVHERALAGAGDAGDNGEHPERDVDVDALQVVSRRAADPAGVGAARRWCGSPDGRAAPPAGGLRTG
ncbi:hypothetical protein GCM10020367_52850 [Streptomyces sannanensis]|uniref:Uncharacterized protein n=1 Tax=Streptomyces sannanensis TaxID=285536 RepID=A0ABP6SIB0_9ACTN